MKQNPIQNKQKMLESSDLSGGKTLVSSEKSLPAWHYASAVKVGHFEW